MVSETDSTDLRVGDSAGGPVVGRLRRMLEDATPGPWVQYGNNAVGIPHGTVHRNVAITDQPRRREDAELIVEVRNRLPALLDIAEAAARVADPDRVYGAQQHDLRAALARLEETDR